jgi:serine/threonine-protein kinase
MGEVWRARDHDLHRDVAVKFLPERYASDAARLGRFAQEARAASQLNHPNIVTIHEIGETSGMPYIVMELVEGRTLRDLLVEDRSLPTKRLLEIGAQIADGLAKAHAAGIVHRDLKPENVMVTGDGYVKILDFGLAKLRSDSSGDAPVWFDTGAPTWPDSPSPETAVGVVLGTVGYMSPEQARGRPVDYRADQFTLGAILYELTTGRPAFRRETGAQTLAAIIDDTPEPIAALNPAVPAPVRWVIEGRCLAKDPAERYASTLDLARDLRQLRERLADADGAMTVRTGEIVPGGLLRRRGARLAGLAAMAAFAAWLAGPVVVERARRLLGPDIPAEKRIVVLPFDAPSGSDEHQALARGVATLLTTRLVQLEPHDPSLWIEPERNVAESGVRTARQAARAFGATLVVSGSVQRASGRLLFTAAIEDARRGRTLRAATAELPDLLADEIVGQLRLELDAAARASFAASGAGVAEAATLTAQALGYAAYAEGRTALEGYERRQSLEQAVSLFQRALERDPDYALGYAGLGEAYWRLYQLDRDATRVELARKACDRALRLNDLLAPVHVTLGIIHVGTGEPERALADFDRALALDPANADALREKARAYEALARPADAEASFRRAAERRPGYWGTHSQLGAFYFRQGRYAEAERALRRALALAPDNARVLASLGGVLQTAGRDDEAALLLERSLALQPNYRAASNLGVLEFKRRRYEEAARAFERALALDDRDFRVWRNLASSYHWAPGQKEKARSAWEKAVRLAEDAVRVNPRDAASLAELASCRAMLGDSARAREDLTRALALAPGNVEVQQLAASVYELVGDRESALAWSRRALAAGYPREQVEQDPFLTALRADPRFPTPASR